MAVPAAVSNPLLVAFWFLTVQDHVVFVGGLAISPCANGGVPSLLAQVPPTIFVPLGHVTVHDETADPPDVWVPRHVT
jgi:hypothetical protein